MKRLTLKRNEKIRRRVAEISFTADFSGFTEDDFHCLRKLAEYIIERDSGKKKGK